MHAILVWFDHLPYGVPGCCGNTEARTPGFDRFAAGSVTFDNCLVDDRCGDSAAGLVEALVALHTAGVPVRVLSGQSTRLTDLLNETAQDAVVVERLPGEAQVLQRLASLSRQTPPVSAENLPTVGDPWCVTVVSMPGVVDVEGAVIDSRLESADRLVDQLAVLPADEQTLLLVTAGGGHVTATDEGGELNERLVHVPLLGRRGLPLLFGLRSPSLIALSDVPWALVCGAGLSIARDDPEGTVHAAALLRELSGERVASRQRLLLRGPEGTVGVRTREWSLQARWREEQGGGRDLAALDDVALYVKPDDLWEHLDVASQSPAVVEELSGMLLPEVEKSGEGPEKHR